jgi:STE24 endopeptidase
MNTDFTPEQFRRARNYHRPLYAALLADAALGLGTLALFAFVVPLDWARGLGWAGAAAVLSALAATAASLATLPVAWFRHRHERRWELTAQGARGWAVDRAKAIALAAVFAAVAVVPLVGLARAFPRWWPLAAAAAGAAFVLLLGFVAPLVLEPIFNRFAPLEDESLARELQELSVRAGVPVRDVLVADASRRTRKHNAYVSGLGRTRRVVLWDTLLAAADGRQIALIVAHELGHRRYRHVAALTALGMAGAAAFAAILWALPIDVADPRSAPRILFLSSLLELAALPFASALSRRFERTADRFSLELTDDPATYERAFRELAVANLADLDPPRALYWAVFSHPTPPQRIAAGRRQRTAV